LVAKDLSLNDVVEKLYLKSKYWHFPLR
jgi:hypothetical protein